MQSRALKEFISLGPPWVACYTRVMAAWRLKRAHNQKISLVLIVALLFFTSWPAHFHVHHAEADAEYGDMHKHIIDMHADARDFGYSHHDDAQILQAAPDGMLKTPLVKVLPFLLLAIVLSVITFFAKQLVTTHRQRVFIPTGYLSHHSPPLRGPPAIS